MVSNGRPAAAHAAERLVDDDASEPGAESRLAAESVETAESANIGLLHCIFGFAVVPHDAARDAIEPAVLLLDDLPDRHAILAARTFDKLVFIGCGLLGSVFGHGDPEEIRIAS